MNDPVKSHGSIIKLLIFLHLCTTPSFLAAQEETPEAGDRAEILFSESVDGGVVFLNGECIVGPYLIEADAETVRINGKEFSPPTPRPRFGFGGMRGFDRQRFGRRPEGRDGDVENSETPSEAMSEPEPPRRRGFRFPSHTTGEARRCREALTNDGILILFDGHGHQEFTRGFPAYGLSRGLLGQWNDQVDEEEFLSLAEGGESVRELWKQSLLGLDLPASVRPILEEKIAKYEEIEEKNNREIAAVARMDRYSYPLTLAGMLLSVVAFGHVLKWMGGGFQAAGENASESSRHVVIALVLMFGMSLVDLAWTVLSEQAGMMTEVNPIAARFVDSPYQLMAFKLSCTLLGFGILFVWRTRYQMQQATCWLCLISVLLTFRWIIFDSLMMS